MDAIFSWIGGKRLLRKDIAELVPEQDIPFKDRKLQYYVEVFGGVAWMLLHKERWFNYEVYNDYNKDLTNLFSVIKFHSLEFKRTIRLIDNNEVFFDYFKKNEPITDIQRAVKTYMKYALSFSANGESFGFKAHSNMNLGRKVMKLSNRFNSVTISNRSYEKLVPRFNKANVFMYLDPPYYGKEYLYEMEFQKEDHKKLCEMLKTFKGKFILSYNKHPDILKLYKDFKIKKITTNYNCFHKQQEAVEEVLILNY
jgi:DNA adenine methylase